MTNGKTIFVEIDMVCWNLCQVYFLEVGLTQIPENHGMLFIVCHVRICISFFIHVNFFGPLVRPSPFGVR